MIIRNMESNEEELLFDIFLSSLYGIASKDYNQKQIEAWASKDRDIKQWNESIRKLNPFVAIIDNKIVGFADLQANGYIDHFFVDSEYARQGIGTSLMEHILCQAKTLSLDELSANVSKTAENLFIKYGFEVIERRFPQRENIILENAFMLKKL